MNTTELTDYILKPENSKYVDISVSENWGLSNYVAKSNGLEYVHRGVKNIDEKIIITKEWKNKSYEIDSGLINFLQNFSSDKLPKEKLDLVEIVNGSKGTLRNTLGFFGGFMLGSMSLFTSLLMLKYNDGNAYYAIAASGALILTGVYSAIALRKGIGTKEYDKFLKLIGVAESADYFIKNSISKEVFQRIK
jgi:hypothetical protein